MFRFILVVMIAAVCRISAFGIRQNSQKCRAYSSSSLKMAQKEATVGMGCFWSPQEKFDKMPGIIESQVGYSGGANTNPSYKTVLSGDGHIEAVKIQYDDTEITYEQILDVFFDRDISAFGNGLGQYQSTIWTETAEQKEQAEKRLETLKKNNDPRSQYVTIREKETFYVAENYHQKYNIKQFPRYIVLAVGGALDVIPGLPDYAYKLGLVLTIGYVAVTIGERILDFGALKKLE
mmetsp:Transcript_30665/g.29276  ORF Transcript_30665/g.29276 Transcript_30665/m.29276 type:complete len:235 (+) Transcript_30665:62-766(+)